MGRRVSRLQRRESLLERLQPAEEDVVSTVGKARVVENIVAMIVIVDRGGEIGCLASVVLDITVINRGERRVAGIDERIVLGGFHAGRHLSLRRSKISRTSAWLTCPNTSYHKPTAWK